MTSQASPRILGVGPRTAAFLREEYDKDRAKRIARDFRVSVKTAERWLSGVAPTTAHIEQMSAKFGERYLRAVFAEAYERQDERINLLEKALTSVYAAGHAAAQLADAAHSSLPKFSTWALDWLTWTKELLGRGLGHPSLPPPDPARTLLIEELVKTVPLALPPPGEPKGEGEAVS